MSAEATSSSRDWMVWPSILVAGFCVMVAMNAVFVYAASSLDDPVVESYKLEPR